MNQKSQHPITPYGVAIHQAIAEGDLKNMKSLLTQAESVAEQQGDLLTAIEFLKVEIAKLERV
ncbi:DUF1843 domain-containing protein [Trinickia terrae]|uniref:DUF1843 domain-containing protein n=1 Tax=Trinickia terrae TaxID=2571161 RepID=A0A4U1ID73_9BURK|nr:DUF1843 domain-containing protein [Trinickia terrae]TKC91596.1 DUF1843 domain-containing protein [Trinickia terrae]